jgi:putative transposase
LIAHQREYQVLPDHPHCLSTLPGGDDKCPARWNQTKDAFTRSLDQSAKPPIGFPQRRERAVWQRGSWERRIRDDTDFARHLSYVVPDGTTYRD